MRELSIFLNNKTGQLLFGGPFVAAMIVMQAVPFLSAEDRAPQSVNWRPVDLGTPDLEPLKKIVANELTDKSTLSERVKAADAHYYLGKYEKDKKLAEKHFEIAEELSAEAMESEPKNVPAILAWCAAKGELAQMRSPLIALGYIKPIQKKFQLLKELAPAHQYYVADRALGRLYQLAPSFISIGSSKKAREHLKAALDGAPESPANQIYWAEFMMDQGEKDEARKYARMTLANPSLLTSSLERFDWVRMANALLEKLGPEVK